MYVCNSIRCTLFRDLKLETRHQKDMRGSNLIFHLRLYPYLCNYIFKAGGAIASLPITSCGLRVLSAIIRAISSDSIHVRTID